MEIKKNLKNNIFSVKNKNKCPTCKKVAKEPYIPFDLSVGDTIPYPNRWQSYDRIKNKNAK